MDGTKPIRFIVFQCVLLFEEVRRNANHAVEWVTGAGADLVVRPELCTDG